MWVSGWLLNIFFIRTLLRDASLVIPTPENGKRRIHWYSYTYLNTLTRVSGGLLGSFIWSTKLRSLNLLLAKTRKCKEKNILILSTTKFPSRKLPFTDDNYNEEKKKLWCATDVNTIMKGKCMKTRTISQTQFSQGESCKKKIKTKYIRTLLSYAPFHNSTDKYELILERRRGRFVTELLIL